MNIQDAFEQARYVHLRKVLMAMGPERVKKAMTAFEDGRSSWSECFFARAYKDELDLTHDAETQLMKAMGFKERISIRFVWQSFDSCQRTGMTRKMLEDMCRDIMGEQLNTEVSYLLKSLQFDPEKECQLACTV